MTSPTLLEQLAHYPLLDALIERRSRRFGNSMNINGGPLAYDSTRAPQPLSLEEEAALAFAACGITGHALAELPYQTGEAPEAGGGNIMTHFVGRTVPSGDAMHYVTLFVINDEGVWMSKRPQDYPRAEIARLSRAAREHKLDILLSAFGEEFAYFLVDERNHFRPPGIARFARSRGGHLHDDPKEGRVATVGFLETWLYEFAAIEQGGMLQNLALMTQALGLGGFPHFAAHPFIWFQALGFRMQEIPFSRTIGAGPVTKRLMKVSNKDLPVPTVVGLERDGEALIKPFCPPYYRTMEEAVLAFVDYKYARGKGTSRDGGAATAWQDGTRVQAGIPTYSEEAIAATIAYCEYVYKRYGRFPANSGPFRTVLAHQAHHLDLDFYDRFYRHEALSETQREHPARPRELGGQQRRRVNR